MLYIILDLHMSPRSGLVLLNVLVFYLLSFILYPLAMALLNDTVKIGCILPREKCPYSEFFWSILSRIRTQYREIRNTDFYKVHTQAALLRKRVIFIF